jgi:hypothetical protein
MQQLEAALDGAPTRQQEEKAGTVEHGVDRWMHLLPPPVGLHHVAEQWHQEGYDGQDKPVEGLGKEGLLPVGARAQL